MEDSAEGVGSEEINGRLANRRRGKGTGNPGKPGKKLRLADLQSQFGVGLKVCSCHSADFPGMKSTKHKSANTSCLCRSAELSVQTC